MKIYLDRLRDGRVEEIQETLSPDFLRVQENELTFGKEIQASVTAYLAEDHLMIRLDATTTASMTCAICNEKIELPISLQNFTHIEEILEIKSSIYDCTELLREAILLQIPAYFECSEGNCPERKVLNPYLRLKNNSTYLPFSGL
jgi:uncharacterized metal-binding protein YceD (DUF177 family)